jgi:hypothetical protein
MCECLANEHTMLKTPVLVRSLTLGVVSTSMGDRFSK